MPLFALTVYWHWSLKGRKNHGHKSTFSDNTLLKDKYYLKILMVRATGGMNGLS